MGIRTTLIVLAGLALGLTACTDRLTTQEAYVSCEELLNRPAADGEEDPVFAECVACHENCGPECSLNGTATPSFSCPDDQGGGGADGGA